MERIENRTFDEIRPGDTASLVRTLSYKDIELFAIMSGDINPTQLDDAFAKSDMFHKVVALEVQRLIDIDGPRPGEGAIGLGDTITVTVKVRNKIEETHR